MIYYITGGERSGKSKHAQDLALQLSSNPIYIATARHWDDDFEKRIQRHVSDRDHRWITLEEEKNLHHLPLEGTVSVIDCVTLWLTNFYVDNAYDVESSLKQAKVVFDELKKMSSTFIIISNEIGMGVHATTDTGRKFVELQGWMNQYIAREADQAVMMVSGLALTLK